MHKKADAVPLLLLPRSRKDLPDLRRLHPRPHQGKDTDRHPDEGIRNKEGSKDMEGNNLVVEVVEVEVAVVVQVVGSDNELYYPKMRR